MSSLADRIAQFQNMTANVPDDELGHFRLGQLLAEDGRHAEAVESFRRTLELAPTFSKVYQLLADSLLKIGDKGEAIDVLNEGYGVADGRGDRVPRDAMASMLAKLGEPVPVSAPVAAETVDDSGPDTGFRCGRPGCPAGKRAVPLPRPPIPDPIGERVQREICTVCWDSWKKDFSVKVINELRLDLSSESGAAEYDKHMREYFGFETEAGERGQEKTAGTTMLVEYGRLGHVGRFPGDAPRDAAVVVRTPRGVELGRVLLPTTAAGGAAGEFLRLAADADFARAESNANRAEAIRDEAATLCAEFPVAIVDCELPLEGPAILHVLPFAACELDAVLRQLAGQFSTPVRVLNVGEPPEPAAKSCGTGCGSGGCSTGGCSSCSTGGCSRKQVKSAGELTTYFAGLREQMDTRAASRLPLG